VRNTAVCRTGVFAALFCATAAVFVDAAFLDVDFGAAFAAGFTGFKTDAVAGPVARRLAPAVLVPVLTGTRSPGYATGIAISAPGSGSSW